MTFKELSTKRFSVRKYTDEPVSKADIEYIMDCVRLAPSAHNFQPWKFLVVTSEEGKDKVRQCYRRFSTDLCRRTCRTTATFLKGLTIGFTSNGTSIT